VISGLSDVDASGHILSQSNAITLRSAIIANNKAGGGGTIDLLSGTYQLSIKPAMSNTFGSGKFHKSLHDAQSGAVAGELTAEALATTLLGLPVEDRVRLAAMLLGQQEGK
jgi:hypothetical protein